MNHQTTFMENKLWQNDLIISAKNIIIAGADEAGRGPLAGPVCAAAVILDYSVVIPEINDSKKLSEKKRNYLAKEIMAKAVCYSIQLVNAATIDKMNILNASLHAMQLACEALTTMPQLCLIDGNKIPPNLEITCQSVIKGDALHACIAAASILAKVYRDDYMRTLDKKYPQYGFARHKGYPTKAHFAALEEYGVIDEHRRSYAPVQKVLRKS